MSELHTCWLKHSTSVCPVILELKTVVYTSKLPDFQFSERLALEHSESNTEFKDRHYLVDTIFVFS